MSHIGYLLDTHALVFWANKENVTINFIEFFDQQNRLSKLFISSIVFWEIAFLVQKGKLAVIDLHSWKDQILGNTTLQLIEPSTTEMIDSTFLPPHHKDPFDRLLIAQANHHNLTLVTQDDTIQKYAVAHFWLK